MKWWIALAFVAGIALALGTVLRDEWATIDASLWQRQISPGPLSASHALLETSCAACHTPLKSTDDVKCIGCHASNTALLQRQPTAFHATIRRCRACHFEHQGTSVRPVAMDHVILADIGLEVAQSKLDDPSTRRLLAWVRQREDSGSSDPVHPRVSPEEAALECSSCHSTKDRHQGLFGRDCASCHATGGWAIAEFKHPSPRSVDCAQCHQAPPSHSMMHFQMVSRSVARQPAARVDQCFVCHQTTSWNDIRGIGWYKHH